MCFGDTGFDTIGGDERAALRSFAEHAFPRHAFEARANADGLTWVVLEPPAARADLLRVTICRIAPCVMVMVEDGAARRQFGSATDLDGAMAFAHAAAEQALLAASNAHPQHEVVQ